MDWIETHGPVNLAPGPQRNVAALADAICWGQRFHEKCGRLIPFLHRHGRRLPSNQAEIVELC